MSFADLIAKKSSSSGECECLEEEGLPEPRSGGFEALIRKVEYYKFYNDEITLRFDVEDHIYYRLAGLGNLIPIDGVTTTVGIIDKSMRLTPWAAKMAIQKLLRIMPTEMVEGIIRIKPITFEEFTVIALEAKGAHKDKLDEASDIGHLAHKCLEDSINFALTNDPEKIVRQLINIPTDELAANAANSGFNWMKAHNTRWVETESKIYSKEWDYAGTMDGLCVCDACDNKACCPEDFKDRLSLCDWKSSNYLKIEYLFQTAAYKHAKMEEHPELKILDTWILRLGKSEEEAGKFDPWHMTPDEYEEDFKGFLACLSLTRLVNSVEERMKGQKSTIRAVKKEQRQTAKAIAKEQEKLQKAIDKAAVKVAKEAEKVRIKAEAKATRDELKAAKKAGINGRDAQGGSAADCKSAAPRSNEGSIPSSPTNFETIPLEMSKEDLPKGIQPRVDDVVFTGGVQCTSTSSPNPESTPLASTPPVISGLQNQITAAPETPQPVVITLTVEAEKPAESISNPTPQGALGAPVSLSYETEVQIPTFKLPMEG